MKKILILLLTGIIMISCTVDPDKRSTLIIQEKILKNSSKYGKYKYKISITFSDYKGIHYWSDYWSDEDWNVGDTLKFVKK